MCATADPSSGLHSRRTGLLTALGPQIFADFWRCAAEDKARFLREVEADPAAKVAWDVQQAAKKVRKAASAAAAVRTCHSWTHCCLLGITRLLVFLTGCSLSVEAETSV